MSKKVVALINRQAQIFRKIGRTDTAEGLEMACAIIQASAKPKTDEAKARMVAAAERARAAKQARIQAEREQRA